MGKSTSTHTLRWLFVINHLLNPENRHILRTYHIYLSSSMPYDVRELSSHGPSWPAFLLQSPSYACVAPYSVFMELKEMSSLPREELELDTYVKPEAPAEMDHGHLDPGHLSFSAIPRPATPPLVITESRPGAGDRSASGPLAASASASRPASEGIPDKPGRLSTPILTFGTYSDELGT